MMRGKVLQNKTILPWRKSRAKNQAQSPTWKKGICSKIFLFVMLLCLMSTSISVIAQAKGHELQMCIGKTKTLTAYTSKKITWTSSKRNIVSVSKNGKVTAKKIGVAKIKAKSGKKIRTYIIKVREHKYQKATCLKAKICKHCGQTEGKKLDHKWKNDLRNNRMVCVHCRKTKNIQNKPNDTVNVYQKLRELKKKYPEGKEWTNKNRYTCKWGNMYYINSGCAAFAAICSDYLYPGYDMKKHTNFDKIKEGDIVRINNNTHSVVVWEISGNKVMFCEGNFGGKIHWGRTMKMSELKKKANHVITRKR